MPKQKTEKKKKITIIDGIDTTKLTREQLLVFALRIKEENDREREERNYFQRERDTIRTYWEITRSELESMLTRLRNKDYYVDRELEKSAARVCFYQQKMKHSLFENQNELAQRNTENMVKILEKGQDYSLQENVHLKDKLALKHERSRVEEEHEEYVKGIKLHQSEKIHEVMQEFDVKVVEIQRKHDKQQELMMNQLIKKHGMEMKQEVERRKTHVSKLIEQHDFEFDAMKNSYNDLTINNLTLIRVLKEKLVELKNENEKLQGRISSLSAENQKLVEPLKSAQLQLESYRKQLRRYNQDKAYITKVEKMLENEKARFYNTAISREALETAYERLQQEHDNLKKTFFESILEVQQKTGFQNELLCRKIEAMSVADKKKYQSDLKTCPHFHTKVERSNEMIKQLQYQLAAVCKTHDDLLETFEAKLKSYGIPENALGFEPLRLVLSELLEQLGNYKKLGREPTLPMIKKK